MISNNTPYKLKASKSSKELNDYDNNHSDENYDNSSVDGDVENSQKYHVYSRENRYRGVGRPRSSEFRSSKINDRRGAYRGRGGPPGRRGDRDGGDFYILNRKYQESLSRHSESSGSYHGKFYEPEKKNDIKLNLLEDTRISKLLRRLSTEVDQENSLAISKKLLEVLLLPDNAQYVRKAFHILGESMFEILQVSPGPLAKQQATRALGRMGYIMGQEKDFERYQNWIFVKMKNAYEEMQILLMKSFKETLAFEKNKPVLQDHAENLMHHLVTCIEITENAQVFKAILDILMTIIELYPDCFYTQFQDTVDLLFGWHVDHTQPLSNIEFISRNLQRISPHFKYNIEFAVTLIENFLEDITNFSSQLNDPESNSLEHINVLILALNTILKCLGDSFRPVNNKHVSVELVSTCLNQIIRTVRDVLESFVADNLIIAANESIGILLGQLDNKSQALSNSIYTLIDLELSLVNEFSDATLVSMLLLISKIIKELSANLPIELIEKLIGPKSEIVKLRYSYFKNIQDSVICVYQALLNLKNVSLLQEAYRYVLGDLEVVYRAIVPNIKPFIQNNPFSEDNFDLNTDQKELTVLFLLRCLSQLANASSIIVMWALKPSILELVGVNLEPYQETLARDNPALQYSLLYLLYSHCKCYNHFISSSNLVAKKQDQTSLMGLFTLPDVLNINDVPNTSPNLGNFEIILDILHKTLSIPTPNEVTLLLLQWLNDILINSDSYLANLYDNEKFVAVTEVLVKCGYHFNTKIVLSVCENLDKLLSNKQLSWNSQFLMNVCDLVKLHLNSNNNEIRLKYSKLSVNVPWDVAVVELNKSNSGFDAKKSTSIKDYSNYMVRMAQHLHLNNSVTGDMYPLQFKTFTDYLLKNESSESPNWLEDIFISSWPLQANYKAMEFFYDLAINSRIILHNWTTLESAQFCVNSKLRTPLGKPNETFTKIEGALNHLGNDLINVKKNKENESSNDIDRVRLLLQFIEHLEKAIYSASEGCAIAMQQPPKQVRSFFITNTNTCSEWLSRIRMVVIHIAMHASDPCTAVRHGQALLGDMVTSGRTSGSEFERIVIFITLALLQMRETEAILGLYIWCKSTAGRKFVWVKYAAEQAAKRYELAIEGYKKVLRRCNTSESDEASENPKLESDTRHFIYDQIVICYKELGNWVDLMNWNMEENVGEVMDNGRRYWFSTTDWTCVNNLFNVEVGRQAFSDLSSWNYKDETTSWSQYEEMTTLETNLYGLAFSIASDNDDLCKKVEENLTRIQSSIRYHLNLAPSDYLQELQVMQYASQGIKNILNGTTTNTVFRASENFENEISKIDSSILRKVLWWSEYFEGVQNQGSTFCTNLRLDVIKRARKERNFKLAFAHVSKVLKDKDLVIDDNGFNTIATLFLQKIGDVSVWSIDTARVIMEIIKLSYCTDQNRQHNFNLCAAASSAISKHAELYGGTELKKISSKILLKLANWLQVNEEICLTEINSPLGKLLMVLPEIGMMDSSVSNVIPMSEMAIGKLLQFSVHQCVGLAKSWNAFGTWCYRWGRKIIDHSSDVQNNLTEEDHLIIKNLLPPTTPPDDLNKIITILSQTRSNLDEEDIESHDLNTSEMIQNQLKYVPVLQNASDADLKSLVQIWRNTQKRIYTYYALSAEAYFKYLHLTTSSENVTKSTECNIITITLRLLRLIVKYALELQNILEEGLQTTPTQPWKVIIPQLFSRLNHPESYVRHRVSDLLCRIAEDAPHLITFPAVVGALEGGLKFDFSEISLPKDCLSQNNECHDEELNEEEDNYESDSEDSTNALQSCFRTMVDTLSKQDPETIAQVQTLVKELRRITLLWDELWLGTLAQHQTEITKRQQQLEYEIEKVNENPHLNKEEKLSLIAEKHRIIIKPIVFVLEQLQEVTTAEAETPHEKEFQEKYLDEIKDVINKLKNPENPEKPQESLQPLKSLQKQFQQKFHRRASYTLKMQSISPVLASIKNTVIAMPGLATSAKTRVTIAHVSNVVSILPTKTKPKKLIFYGSDGQTYTYLFKGLEDLHLDERIMQFLSIANTMMAHNADLTGQNLYRARHYSVIPLGPRSGLISWVDGTTPVFALYKRWQQREIAKPFIKNNVNTTASVLRPSELFYNKLNPLLKEHGIKNIENRKEWPLSVLKQVLTELMAETPSDLLAKELWCNAIDANTWWQVVKRYSYSVAVMSIIGYIIGLGDRHLDNVLVDLTSGEVVHIDYNVCFEKGKTLRVPEKVPFRLTPNIRGALGITGVEGIFRTACENVLKTMRKGRETLLTLLEAFVYDPLIDWTVGGEVLAGTSFGGISSSVNSRQSKKDLEKEVTLSMFNVRCTEMKVEWEENKENILRDIPTLLENFQSWIDVQKKISETEDYLQDLHQQMALVKEAEAHGANKHSLYNLPSRYEIYCKTQEAMKTAKKDIDKIMDEAENHITGYLEALKLLESPQFAHWISDLKAPDNDMNIFDLVKEFLHNAGKNDVITQCEQSESDVEQLSKLQNLSIRRCLQLLQEYHAILSQCPKSYIENHRMYLYLNWSKFMLDTKTVESCDAIYEKFRMFLDFGNAKHTLQFSYSLETFYKETIAQVNKLYEDLTKIRTQESSVALEKLYANARLGVSTFLNCEKGATSAFEFVIANELVLLNKNFLTLETAASRSGDLLIKLTSRDGDWFLDELVLNSTRVVEMINNLPVKQEGEVGRFVKVLNGIRSANNVYKGLHELHFNFHTIILPESMKKIQSEEPTVVQMVADLGSLIGELGTTIPDMIAQLEKILSCLFMQMDINPSYEIVLGRVAAVRSKFQLLIQSQSDTLSAGKMLLMGFNGLFEKLSQEMHTLVSTLGSLDIPSSWKKLDQVKEAKSIGAHIFNPRVHDILEDIFLLKRLQTMSEFFGLVLEMCQSFKANAKHVIFNDDQLVKPVRQFIADFISRQLLGITTEAVAYCVCFLLQNLSLDVSHEIEQKDIGAETKVPLDELCHKAWNYLFKQGVFSQNLVSQASGFSTNLKSAWEKIQEPKKIELKLTVLQSSALRIQNQLTVYNFMYEEILSQLHVYTGVRNKFIVDLKTEITNLKTVHSKLIEAREKQQCLIENAYQRLNWAKGANPNVVEISAAFESAVSTRDTRLNLEQKIANEILTACKVILQHELLRTPCNESKAYDKLFLNSFEKWRIACQYTNSRNDVMTPTEESIMNLLTAELLHNPKWLQAISEIISDLITMSQKKLTEEKANLMCISEDLTTEIEKFKEIYNIHCRLMSDVKSLIKSMTKIEDYTSQTQQFIADYRLYIDSFSSLFSKFKREMSLDDVQACIEHLRFLEQNTNQIYGDLLNLEAKRNRPQLTRQDCIAVSPIKVQKQESKGQQRNAYAVNVWRRVKMKLEGRDPDPGRKYTSQEQVDYVIREATNLDNLALLYEGWTPWV
ncbi:serine/threonine-protein kinase SMG1 [Tribolium castaneum]|uniref:non-specific serine/threonine protein kinase n=1 Tax=Tribolium castaneum TaxID=7070 RepID=A0A139WLQ5_TRICA|nr:PREDICTED: serine/threonine-protein kinase SMG1 [Tribolium castaneum]KYB28836.1 Serine/threonine-protein kinase Smg1-like Protein [Tribolium castaneum]|eukprot:XP_008190660.1 PREDICTED: serine/threonine-protein kinase SMG1 [Tribolium castaneum]